jgi:hypothetical protein
MGIIVLFRCRIRRSLILVEMIGSSCRVGFCVRVQVLPCGPQLRSLSLNICQVVGALQMMEIVLRSDLMLIPNVAFATMRLRRKTLDDVMVILGSLAQILYP